MTMKFKKMSNDFVDKIAKSDVHSAVKSIGLRDATPIRLDTFPGYSSWDPIDVSNFGYLPRVGFVSVLDDGKADFFLSHTPFKFRAGKTTVASDRMLKVFPYLDVLVIHGYKGDDINVIADIIDVADRYWAATSIYRSFKDDGSYIDHVVRDRGVSSIIDTLKATGCFDK